MQLVVTMNDGDVDLEPLELTIGSFDDQDKFAGRVARTVKRWLRTVPVRKAPSRLDIRLFAAWTETTPRAEAETKQRRKAKKGKADG